MQARATEAQVASGKASAGDVLATRMLQVQTHDRVLATQRQQQAAKGTAVAGGDQVWIDPDSHARRVNTG